MFDTAYSDILILLAFKVQGARIENGISVPITITSTEAVDPLKYLCWVNDSFESFVKSNVSQFDSNRDPLPSRPQGNISEGYSLFFPISDNTRYLIRKSDSNRAVVWTRSTGNWKTNARFDIRPHESIIEVVSKEAGRGAVIRLRPDYVYSASIYFAPKEGTRCSIPWQAFVIWCCRNEIFGVVPTFDDMAQQVKEHIHLSEEEIHHLFVSGPDSLKLTDIDFENQRDDMAYNQLLCFGEPEIPVGVAIRPARPAEQLKLESQLLGLTEADRIKPLELATRMWQSGHLNLLFTGAPRTSKSHCALQVAEEYLGITRTDEAQWKQKVLQIQFHQEWRYGDFVQKQIPALQGGALSFVSEAGIFLKHCNTNRVGKSVMIIEEINRANVAAVFGEAFYLIEMAYRGRSLPLPHGGGEIMIPQELLLIATMNTIDRSTYALDYALLSRFRTIPFDVDYQEMKNFLTDEGSFNDDEALEIIKDIREISGRTKFPIGQAHFVYIKNRGQLYDWYITVLRPALQLFLTKYQEHSITEQIDPIMEKYRG